MTTTQQAHALEVALTNLRCGETLRMTELYILAGFPSATIREAHDIALLAGRLMDCDPEYVRN